MNKRSTGLFLWKLSRGKKLNERKEGRENLILDFILPEVKNVAYIPVAERQSLKRALSACVTGDW